MKSSDKTFADRIIHFNQHLKMDVSLPDGFNILNPFDDNQAVNEAMTLFYKQFYDDDQQRKFLIGINPGRFGAGTTGVPFTDTKRLQEICGISISTPSTHEPSATFIYDMIEVFGGPHSFYGSVYINSLFPLAIIRKNAKGNWVNCNYYDDKLLFEAVKPLIIENLKVQIDLGVSTDKVYVLGKKNAQYLEKINQESHLFGQIEILEHPRYIQQYKYHDRSFYIQKYIDLLK